MKDKGFYGILIIWIVFAILDFWSTVNGSYIVGKTLEANPLVHLTGFGGVIVLNIAVAIVFWLVYTKRSMPTTNFIIITSLFFIITTRFIIIQNNLATHATVEELNLTIQQVEAMATPEMKMKTMKYVAALIYAPMVATILPFLIWRMDHACRKR